MHKLDAILENIYDHLYNKGLPYFSIGDEMNKLDQLKHKKENTALEQCVIWAIKTDEVKEEAASQIERYNQIELASIGVCKSFECYTAMHKPEAEWDEYDQMMIPLWRNLVEILGINLSVGE